MNNNKIINLLSEEYKSKIKDPSKTFVDLGFDSLDRFSIILEIGDKLEINFKEKDMENFNSINDIENFLNKK